MRYYQAKRSPEAHAYWKAALGARIPEAALPYVAQLMSTAELELHISRPRATKLGHYRAPQRGQPQCISINIDLSPERFLLTLVHELAHLFTHQEYARGVKPHGPEWKRCFQQLMTPLLCEEVFNKEILPYLIAHLNSPKASSCADPALYRKFEELEGIESITVADLAMGDVFSIANGRSFERGEKKRTRYLCYELPGRRAYLINGATSIRPKKQVLSPN